MEPRLPSATGRMHVIFFANIVSNTAQQFGVDWPHLIAQIISFLIVAGLLYKFAYKRIQDILEERRERIAEGLANAEKIKAELAKTEAARKEILDRANTEADRLIEEAKDAAARLQEQEAQKAIRTAEQIMARAQEAATADRDRIMAELKRELGQLVVDTAIKVTGKVLSPEDQRRLAEETNRELAA
jgi:F-type H+-transporting ATPase subunit b